MSELNTVAKKPSKVIIFLLLVLFGVLAAVVASIIVDENSPSNITVATPSQPTYAGGQLACPHFRNIISDLSLGILTENQGIEKLQEVGRSASTAEPAIRAASINVIQTALRTDVEAFLEAILQMNSACSRYRY